MFRQLNQSVYVLIQFDNAYIHNKTIRKLHAIVLNTYSCVFDSDEERVLSVCCCIFDILNPRL